MFRHWYRCDVGHQHNQWTTEGPEPTNSPCTLCGLLQFGREAEEKSHDYFRGVPVNLAVQPGTHLQCCLFDQVLNEDPD
jgi:hypothetical protein